MIQSESKQIILSVIGISVLIIAFVGISYAAFTSSLADSNQQGISTGTISLVLKNESSNVSIKNMMPMSIEDGKKLTGDGNVYDFTVESNLSHNTTLNYEISIEKVVSDQPSLNDGEVRFYLQRMSNGEFIDTSITSNPQPFIALKQDSFLGSKKGTMVIYSGTLSNLTDKDKLEKEEFRLRMWVDQETIIDSVSKQFNIKLNVTAKAI